MLILHQIVCQKLRLILLRASQMANDYGEGPWAPPEIFVRGGEEQVRKGPHMYVEKAPTPHKRSRKGLPPPLPAPMGGGGAIATFSLFGDSSLLLFSPSGGGRGGCPYGGWGRVFWGGFPLPYKHF